MKKYKIDVSKIVFFSILIICVDLLFICCKKSPTGPEPLKFGNIQVNSTPSGAQVYLDGVNTGKNSDCLLTDVTAGNHTIKLVLEGYADYETNVLVSDGQTTNLQIGLARHTINVIAPAMGTVWIKGEQVEIKWEMDSLGTQGALGDTEILTITDVTIELFHSNNPVETIRSKTINDGIEHWTVSKSLDDGLYKVKICCASDQSIYGKSDKFEIKNPSVIPSLIEPEEGAILDNGRTDSRDNIEWHFTWSKHKEPTKYNLYVKHKGAIYPAIDIVVQESFYHHVSGGYIANFNRFNWGWKVRAFVSGRWCDWSEERSFDVEPVNTDRGSGLSGGIPKLLSPKEGAMLDNGRTDRQDSIIWNFDWTDVMGATRYNIYVKHKGAIYPVIDREVRDSSYHHVSTDSYITNQNRFNWRWKVRAFVSGRWCDWSETRSFDVEPVNTDPPSK